MPGAILLGFGVVGLRLAMVVYFVPKSADLAERYGTIGIALVLLTWAYWLGMVIIGGSELNAAVFRSRQERLAESAARPERSRGGGEDR
jgi:membrane protein